MASFVPDSYGAFVDAIIATPHVEAIPVAPDTAIDSGPFE